MYCKASGLKDGGDGIPTQCLTPVCTLGRHSRNVNVGGMGQASLPSLVADLAEDSLVRAEDVVRGVRGAQWDLPSLTFMRDQASQRAREEDICDLCTHTCISASACMRKRLLS